MTDLILLNCTIVASNSVAVLQSWQISYKKLHSNSSGNRITEKVAWAFIVVDSRIFSFLISNKFFIYLHSTLVTNCRNIDIFIWSRKIKFSWEQFESKSYDSKAKAFHVWKAVVLYEIGLNQSSLTNKWNIQFHSVAEQYFPPK